MRTSCSISQGESILQLSPATTPEEMALLEVSDAVDIEAEVVVVATIATMLKSTSIMMIPIDNRPRKELKIGIKLITQTFSPEPRCIL